MNKRYVAVILTLFAVLSIVFLGMRTYAPSFDFPALEAGNVIMALLALATHAIISKQMEKSPHAFVRGVSGSSFLKLMVCMVAILIYILLNRASIHKPTIFMLFGIYAIYTITETWLLSKIAREQK